MASVTRRDDCLAPSETISFFFFNCFNLKSAQTAVDSCSILSPNWSTFQIVFASRSAGRTRHKNSVWSWSKIHKCIRRRLYFQRKIHTHLPRGWLCGILILFVDPWFIVVPGTFAFLLRRKVLISQRPQMRSNPKNYLSYVRRRDLRVYSIVSCSSLFEGKFDGLAAQSQKQVHFVFLC